MPSPEPRVSVIIPVYNAARFLHETLESVVSQTLQEIEILLVDDGSTDDSLQIMREFESADCLRRIRIIEQANAGAGVARNTGLASARGEYLSFLDADDSFAPTMLERMLAQAVSSDADVVVARWIAMDSVTGKQVDADWFWAGKPFLEPVTPHSLRKTIFTDFVGWSWDKLIRSELVRSNGLQFQSITSTNDACFIYMALVLASRVVVMPDQFVMHRTRVAGSIEAVRSWRDFFTAADEVESQLRVRGIWDEYRDAHTSWLANRCLWDARTLPETERKEVITYACDAISPKLAAMSDRSALRPVVSIFFALIPRPWPRRVLGRLIGVKWLDAVVTRMTALKRASVARRLK